MFDALIRLKKSLFSMYADSQFVTPRLCVLLMHLHVYVVSIKLSFQ